ncbi:MAG: exodeoxyribonuclease VII large subunit [Gammaproteobacteria bacterium]|nr:exodeoxyribonuclease VII large subunit [Gammaproteobacteria bacterium]
METIDISQTQEIFTVSRLNREVRFMLEGTFPMLWVEGEISNFAAPHSGHWYFSLKDASAQVRCAMFKPNNRRLGFTPKDGMHVMLKARVSLYEGRGDFQLIGEHMEEVGEGKLRQAFDALKKRLSEAGLFDTAHKKPFPPIPTSLGVITSPTGAAIQDILSVLGRRFPSLPVIIYPTPVQGDTAAPHIVNAIRTANRRKECDVLILARGGGSLEDLWPFNEEIVANAIFKSEIPIISGVGHEVDFTIADFVADQRAPTPSAAAELVTPDSDELSISLERSEQRLARQIQHKIRQFQQTLTWTNKHLQQQHPKRRLAEQTQRLDLYELTLARLQKKLLTQHQATLATLKVQLAGLKPTHLIREIHNQLSLQQQSLSNIMQRRQQQEQQQLASLAAKLDGLSPLSTLKRGYSITTKNHEVLRSANQTQAGDKIHITLMEGSLDCTVNQSNE